MDSSDESEEELEEELVEQIGSLDFEDGEEKENLSQKHHEEGKNTEVTMKNLLQERNVYNQPDSTKTKEKEKEKMERDSQVTRKFPWNGLIPSGELYYKWRIGGAEIECELPSHYQNISAPAFRSQGFFWYDPCFALLCLLCFVCFALLCFAWLCLALLGLGLFCFVLCCLVLDVLLYQLKFFSFSFSSFPTLQLRLQRSL